MSTDPSGTDDAGGPQPAMDVRRSLVVPAPVERVWDAVADPDRLSQWLGCDVRLAARPDATGMIRDASGRVRRARVVELDPPRRYVFEWWYRGGLPVGEPRSSRVEISLSADAGGTRVEVVERAIDVAGPAGGSSAAVWGELDAASAARIMVVARS